MSMQPLPSEQVILSAPMSFAGSTRRLWRSWHPRSLAARGWKRAGIRTLFVTLLVLWWAAIVCWYSIFGLFVVPYRIIRRVQRHGEMTRLRHAEMIAAVQQRGQP